jgi:hypothetical protein
MEDFRDYLEAVCQAPRLRGTCRTYAETEVSNSYHRVEDNPENPPPQSYPCWGTQSDRRTLQPPRRQNLRCRLLRRLPRKKITYDTCTDENSSSKSPPRISIGAKSIWS